MTEPMPLDASLWDDSIPVADDFYLHVNGRWLAANPVPAEYPMWGAYVELDQRNKAIVHRLLQEAAAAGPEADLPTRLAGDLFAAGMDEAAIASAGIEPLRGYLARIDAIASVDDARALHLDLQLAGIGVFYDIGVEADFEDASVHLAYLGQAGLGLPERSYYLDSDERSVAIRAAYRAHVAAQLTNLGRGDAATAAADAILAFETRLATASLSREQQRDPRITMNRFRLDGLDELMPSWGLASYARDLGIDADTVSVDSPDFLRALDLALVETSMDTLRDVLRWHLIRACASSMAPAFEDEQFSFYGRTLGGQQEQQERWKRIVDVATADVGDAVAQLFVRETFPPQAKQRMEQLVGHLLSAMRRAIETNDWMGEATRAMALTKLARFGSKIGYPDEWRDYTGLALDRRSYLASRMAASAFEVRRQLALLGRPVDPGEWSMPAHVVNAYYHPLRNEIVFPAGILQPPFFYAAADDALNYGGIGTVIGHEITHGFDDTGSRYDAAGALRDWWTAEDRSEFERRATVLAEQSSAFVITEGVTLNGRLTLGENIADLGGLTISLAALHEVAGSDTPSIDGLTADQRFFLAYATMWRMGYTDAFARLLATIDTHSPSRYRVNGPLANLGAFASAFGIPVGSPMALPVDQRAMIW